MQMNTSPTSLSRLMMAGTLLLTMGLATNASAGGIALGATRVIYPQGDKQVSLPVINSSADNTFLIQSWVANVEGIKSPDFILTPSTLRKRTRCVLCISAPTFLPIAKLFSI